MQGRRWPGEGWVGPAPRMAGLRRWGEEQPVGKAVLREHVAWCMQWGAGRGCSCWSREVTTEPCGEIWWLKMLSMVPGGCIKAQGAIRSWFFLLGFYLLLWTEIRKSFRSQLKHFSAYGNCVLTLVSSSGQVILASFGNKEVRLNPICSSQATLNANDFIPYIHSGLNLCQDHPFWKKYTWDLWLWPDVKSLALFSIPFR